MQKNHQVTTELTAWEESTVSLNYNS